MLEEGDSAPTFTAPMAEPAAAARTERGNYTGDDVSEFDLGEELADGPVVLAFYPGVYSRTCTEELCEFRDWLSGLQDLDAALYGVSADTPWSLLAFIDEYDLQYPLLSGFNNAIIREFGVQWEEGLLAGIAVRSVFVVDEGEDGPEVTYAWTASEEERFPDLGAIESIVGAAV